MTPEQQMLCLAALTYRDFADAGPPLTHGVRFRQDVEAKLEALAPHLGRWTLVWGPASYRAPMSLFDDAAAFVVQNADRPNQPPQYVVAVRGTNPISAFDWLFGDFWVAGQVPWSFDPTGKARISLSTALGLGILLQLQATDPPAGAAAKIWNRIDQGLDTLAGVANEFVTKVRSRDAIRVRDDVQRVLGQVAAARLRVQARDPGARLAEIQKQWLATVREPMITTAVAGLDVVGGTPSLQLLNLLEKHSLITARLNGGNDLTAFLRAAVLDSDGPLEVIFTGHSKGGALAPTLALWFAENQGNAADRASRWDSHRHATVSCYHFAGPTAGNAEFVARSDEKIGDRCFGFVNPLDIVTKAWQPDDVRSIAKLYDADKVLPIPALALLSKDIADILIAQKLEYRHVGRHVRKLDTTLADGIHDFVGQFVYQHLEAYIAAMGIDDVVSLDTFFNPLQ